jgi:hypothetical protein
MSLNDSVTEVFKGLSTLGTEQERKALEKKAKSFTSVSAWREYNIALVVSSGAVSGMAGGLIGMAAIPVDLAWCGRVGGHGSIGIGYILGHDVDYEQDMNMILAIWGGVCEASMNVPAGKVGIKIGGKIGGKAAAIVGGAVTSGVVYKYALKGSSKLSAKLASKAASKAATKFLTKLTAKTGFGWIPLIGGVVSAGVNWWLVDGLLTAGEEYYNNDYIIINDTELANDFSVEL